MATEAEPLGLFPLSAERPLRPSIASHLVPQDSSSSGEGLLNKMSVESDYFRVGSDQEDGHKLYPLLVSDSPKRKNTATLHTGRSQRMEEDFYLLTHSFPPPGSPGLQHSLSGRFVSYQQTEADTYEKIKADLQEERVMAGSTLEEPLTARVPANEQTFSFIKKSGTEGTGMSKRVFSLSDASSGKENTARAAQKGLQAPSEDSNLLSPQRYPANPSSALGWSRSQTPSPIQDVLSRAYERQRKFSSPTSHRSLKRASSPDSWISASLPSSDRKAADPDRQRASASALPDPEAGSKAESQPVAFRKLQLQVEQLTAESKRLKANGPDIKPCMPSSPTSTGALAWTLGNTCAPPQANRKLTAISNSIGTPTFRVQKGCDESFVEAVNALYSKRNVQHVMESEADEEAEDSSLSQEEAPPEDMYRLRSVGLGLLGARNALFEASRAEEAAAVGLTPRIPVPAAAAVVKTESCADTKPAEEESASEVQDVEATGAGQKAALWGMRNVLYEDSSGTGKAEALGPETARAANKLWRETNPTFDSQCGRTDPNSSSALSSLSSAESLGCKHASTFGSLSQAASPRSELSQKGAQEDLVLTPSLRTSEHPKTSSGLSPCESQGSTEGTSSLTDPYPFSPAGKSSVSLNTAVKGSETAASPISSMAADSVTAIQSSPAASPASTRARAASLALGSESGKPAHLPLKSPAGTPRAQGSPAASRGLIRSVRAALEDDVRALESKSAREQSGSVKHTVHGGNDSSVLARKGSVRDSNPALGLDRAVPSVRQGSLAATSCSKFVALPAAGSKAALEEKGIKQAKKKKGFRWLRRLACLGPATLDSDGEIVGKRA